MHCLTDYDIKILMAFYESLMSDEKFTKYLYNNGFPELAALSNAIHSDTNALDWLLKESSFPEFGVLSNAIDNEENAIKWLEKYNCTFLSTFAAACRKEDEAIKWFVDNDLKVFVLIIKRIHEILLFQSWDSSDMHKRRMS